MGDSKRKDIEGFPRFTKDNPPSEIGNPQSNGRVGYLELLRSNRDFRNLWLGQVVSELGDWFSIIALFNLLLQLTNRARSVGWFLIIIHLPIQLFHRILARMVGFSPRTAATLLGIYFALPGFVWIAARRVFRK
jgi:hypothetical protein